MASDEAPTSPFSTSDQRLGILDLIRVADTLAPTTHEVLKSVLKEKGVKYTLVEYPGYVHAWPVWRVTLRDLLPRLFQPAAK